MYMALGMKMKVFGPLEHYDYAAIDAHCGCGVCEDWRGTYKAFEAARLLIINHERSCLCVDCKAMYSARSRYLAALNRRDLYSEASYHATRDPSLGPQFMSWVGTQMVEPRPKSQNWWEIKAPALSLLTWFTTFEKASYAIQVSGASAA